jgi:transcriptional regulator with XRE-family HTH domain
MERMKQTGGSPQDAAREVQQHCGVSLLRAHRLVRGWTLLEAAENIRQVLRDSGRPRERLTHQRISRWEIGDEMPSPDYLEALCKAYRSRPDLLGFGRDYSSDAVADSREAISEPPQMTQTFGHIEAEEMVNRRDLITRLGALGGAALAAGSLLDAVRKIRDQTDALLETQFVSPTSVDWWESQARDYGYLKQTTPTPIFLADATADFARLRSVLARRQPLEFQRRLYHVMAQLAGLIGLSVLGMHVGEARSWFHTARLAADETGDRALRAWVMAYDAVPYMWGGGGIPVQRAVELCQTAQAVAGSASTPAGALAAANEARAQAKLGRRRETLDAIERAERHFARLADVDIDGNRLGFYEHRLRYCQENALTLLGETGAAMDLQRRAEELPRVDVIDSIMVKLDRSACHIRNHEPEEGCRVASQVILELSPAGGWGLVLTRAREILDLVPGPTRRLEAACDLAEVLQSRSEQTTQPLTVR